MKKLSIAVFFILFLSQLIAQKAKKDSFPFLVMPVSLEYLKFFKTAGNTFDMKSEAAASTMLVLNVHKRFSLIAGGRLWVNLAGTSTSSRNFAQFGVHTGIGVLFNQRLQYSRMFVGPVLATQFLIPAGVPAGPDNVKYANFSAYVIEKRPYVRGNYWNALYLFIRWNKEHLFKPRRYELEANLFIPGNYPDFLLSFQPNSLVPVARLKASVNLRRISLKADAQVPSLFSDEDSGGYGKVRLDQTIYRVEIGYKIPMNNLALKFTAGYKYAWHALNFPTLLEGSDMTGTWRSFYLGTRVEFMGIKWLRFKIHLTDE